MLCLFTLAKFLFGRRHFFLGVNRAKPVLFDAPEDGQLLDLLEGFGGSGAVEMSDVSIEQVEIRRVLLRLLG